MIRQTMAVLLLCLLVTLPALAHDKATKRAERRAEIDRVAGETLDELFAESPKARSLYESAYGYAVFDNIKISLVITGGGGAGVAVDKSSGNRTYMKMGTAGLNVGLGGQKYQVVFLFEDAQTFNSFVNKGWQAEGSANAVAGKAGANAAGTFTNGLAVYQLTQGGLMLQADISGTKYWRSKKLNN